MLGPLTEFGENVRRLRLSAGLSQEELAQRSGLHRTYVSDVERGVRNIGLANTVKLAHALGVEPARLLEGIA